MDLISGIISGLITSITLFTLMLCIKPKIKISNDIYKQIEGDTVCYYIKVVNISRCMFIDVEYKLSLCSQIKMPDKHGNLGSFIETEDVEFAKKHITVINGYSKKNSNNDNYAYWLTINADLSKLLAFKGNFLEFSISGKHNISNRMKCFNKSYVLSNIKLKPFYCGKSTEINNN
ncbi:MAG: hypothetical protein PHE12_03335 [Clostridia bacterium]|nr:hypothetical protein [Clostridia bacterium]